MSGGESINISTEDLQLVQNRVERCLQHYMNKREAIKALAMNDNIDPTVTELIWQRLEEQNPEFFKAYYLKLVVKDQIMEFNRLLSKQVELMRRTGEGGGDGSHVSPLQQPLPTSSCTAKSSRIPKTVSSIMQQQQENYFVGLDSSVLPSTTVQATTFDDSVSPSMIYTHNPNVGLARASNGNIPGVNYSSSSQFSFCPPGNFVEAQPMTGDACMSSYSGGGGAAASMNIHHHHLLSGDCSSFGFLPQIPPNLSFSDLAAADFPDSSDILGSYSRPHHSAPPPEANGFVDPNEGMERFNPEGGNLRYQPWW